MIIPIKSAASRTGGVMKDVTVTRGHSRAGGPRPGLSMVPTQPQPKGAAARAVAQSQQAMTAMESGIVVSEEELRSIKAQRLYKLRCDCGRSWFELELPKLMECPACKKLGLVSA